jgi:hypothetical protein
MSEDRLNLSSYSRRKQPRLNTSLFDRDFSSDRESLFSQGSPFRGFKAKISSTPDNFLKLASDARRRQVACPECSKVRAELLETQESSFILQEKLIANEKRLKQYDGLLVIKENRLKEQETVLNAEKETLAREKADLDNRIRKKKEKSPKAKN